MFEPLRTRLVTAEGPPWPGGWPAPEPTPLLPEAPPPCRLRVAVTAAAGVRPCVGSPRPILHPGADEASVGFPGLPKGRRAGRGCRQQRFHLSAWRLGAWAQGPGPPGRGSSRGPSGRGRCWRSWFCCLWLPHGHPCLHRSVASLPLGKAPVLRPPSSQKDLVTGGGAITSSKASLPKTSPAWAPGAKTQAHLLSDLAHPAAWWLPSPQSGQKRTKLSPSGGMLLSGEGSHGGSDDVCMVGGQWAPARTTTPRTPSCGRRWGSQEMPCLGLLHPTGSLWDQGACCRLECMSGTRAENRSQHQG